MWQINDRQKSRNCNQSAARHRLKSNENHICMIIVCVRDNDVRCLWEWWDILREGWNMFVGRMGHVGREGV